MKTLQRFVKLTNGRILDQGISSGSLVLKGKQVFTQSGSLLGELQDSSQDFRALAGWSK